MTVVPRNILVRCIFRLSVVPWRHFEKLVVFLVSHPTLLGVWCATKIILLLSLVLSVHVLVMYLITVVCAYVSTPANGS